MSEKPAVDTAVSGSASMFMAAIARAKKTLRPLKNAFELLKGQAAVWKLRRNLKSPPAQRPHGLPGELIVSLTSYPPRFPTLLPTLQCLLMQSVKPDRVVLWISNQTKDLLPPEILALEGKGLEFGLADEKIRSYKKIIPALQKFPDAFIVTADDDAYYPPDWLEELLNAWDGDNKKVVCHRAHGILTGEDGRPIPYSKWSWRVKGPSADPKLFLTGVGGALYPPGSLPLPDALDAGLFTAIAPTADDVWLNWMARLAGSAVVKSGWTMPEAMWPGSAASGLVEENTRLGANDRQIAAMIERFGFPFAEKER